MRGTPVAVYMMRIRKTRNNRGGRGWKNQKSEKFFEKTAVYPLEMKSVFMYNLSVVCLGMKW